MLIQTMKFTYSKFFLKKRIIRINKTKTQRNQIFINLKLTNINKKFY